MGAARVSGTMDELGAVATYRLAESACKGATGSTGAGAISKLSAPLGTTAGSLVCGVSWPFVCAKKDSNTFCKSDTARNPVRLCHDTFFNMAIYTLYQCQQQCAEIGCKVIESMNDKFE